MNKVLFTFFIIFLLCTLAISGFWYREKEYKRVAALYLVDDRDLKVYLDSSHYTLNDFLHSEGVRRNFRKWQSGYE